MTTMRDDFEALMPEPFAYPQGDIVGPCACGSWPGGKCMKCPPVSFFTADQMREAIRAATERAAEEATALATDAAIKYANGHPVDFSKEVGDAIRGGERSKG